MNYNKNNCCQAVWLASCWHMITQCWNDVNVCFVHIAPYSGVSDTSVTERSTGARCVSVMQSMDVSKFWDLMINALKAANEVSPLNKN